MAHPCGHPYEDWAHDGGAITGLVPPLDWADDGSLLVFDVEYARIAGRLNTSRRADTEDRIRLTQDIESPWERSVSLATTPTYRPTALRIVYVHLRVPLFRP